MLHLHERKIGNFRHRSQVAIGYNSNNSPSPKKDQSASPGRISNSMLYPAKLATVQMDKFDESGHLPARRIKPGSLGSKLGSGRLLKMTTMKKGQKTLAELVGWRSISRA